MRQTGAIAIPQPPNQRRTTMRRALVMAGAGVALATALMVSLTTGATAAPLGPATQTTVGEAANDLLMQANYRGRGHHGYGYGYRSRGPSFGFYLGAPAYYSYSRCWWSHRYHRRVCTY
jgi:hypothetical protein